MKNIVVLCSLVVSGLAYALVGSWTGVIFSFNQTAVVHAVADLAAKNDSAYVAAKKIDPKLVESLRASFQNEFDIAANGFVRPSLFVEDSYVVNVGQKPPGLPDPRTGGEPEYNSPDESEMIFWNVYDLKSFAPLLGAAQGFLIPESLRHDRNDSFTYTYCEQNPKGDYCERKSRQVDVGVALARRIVSNPLFVKEVCSSFATVLKRHVDWSNDYLSAKNLAKTVNLDAHFDLIDQTLAYLEAGAWNANKYDSNFARWQKFLFRRYLDGGPQLMTASRECLQNVRQAMAGPAIPPTTSPDPVTTGYLQDMMVFQAKPYPGNPRRSLDLQTKYFDIESVARIFRQIPPNVQMPKITSSRRGAEEDLVELGQVMSSLDPKYDYRLITADEYNGFLRKDNKITCVANKDYLNFGYEGLELQEAGEREDHDYKYGCTFERLTFVRIEKASNNR